MCRCYFSASGPVSMFNRGRLVRAPLTRFRVSTCHSLSLSWLDDHIVVDHGAVTPPCEESTSAPELRRWLYLDISIRGFSRAMMDSVDPDRQTEVPKGNHAKPDCAQLWMWK